MTRAGRKGENPGSLASNARGRRNAPTRNFLCGQDSGFKVKTKLMKNKIIQNLHYNMKIYFG